VNVAILSRQPSGGEDWALWHKPREILNAQRIEDVQSVLDAVENATRQGRYALGFLTYEAGAAFDNHFIAKKDRADLPFAWFAIFDSFIPYTFQPAQPSPCSWEPLLSQATYEKDIDEIKRRIALGETYQVNYTFHLRAKQPALMKSLFQRLYRSQPTPFAIYIETPKFSIASVSPELFFRLDGDSIVCEPMKGTCPRAPHPALDDETGKNLQASAKNRAENLMIVDMIRNDLGRIAKSGSVDTSEMFKVTPWPTLWQMTSTVKARTTASLREIFGALFPSASITGAPKLQTSKIIGELEPGSRGIYTGAIGWAGPDRKAQFSVAIRTAVQDAMSLRTTYGIGSGIVWDSVPDEEYQECLLKARVLEERIAPDFQLLETIRWERAHGFFQLEEHLNRLAVSATYFGFHFDRDKATATLNEGVTSLEFDTARVRLLVSFSGEVTVEPIMMKDSPVCLQPEGAPQIFASLDTDRQDASSPFWYHKTTKRTMYDEARKRFPLADEVLLVNTRGELMEFTNGNIVIKRGGAWLTPPLSSGLLPGVFRETLIRSGYLAEQIIPASELCEEDAVYFINSVRGWRSVQPLSWSTR
jgi:para-aminobenzoate synthetase/4-amino-4-deoxychorismate lyase